MKIKVVYENPKDKELLELVDFATPFFIEYIDIKTKEGKKEGWKIKNEFGARKDPFIEILDDEDNFKGCLWSEDQNACQSFIKMFKNNGRNSL